MIPYSSMLSKNTRIMEEVWKDINLSSLQQDMPSTPSLPPNHLEGLCGVSSSTTTSFQSIILQDFLTEHFKATSDRSPPPSTALGLNSNLGGGSNGLSSSSASSVFSDGVGDSVVACCSKKHPLEHELNQESGDRSDVDRRKKRLIKNPKESCAGSPLRACKAHPPTNANSSILRERRTGNIIRRCKEKEARPIVHDRCAERVNLGHCSSSPISGKSDISLGATLNDFS
ncbi:Basic region leucine zipper [Musa troglodytarum]|uniref:Basic region leucine zipper n=1 Tax=Musa troglodytarum TaxID=320322 RepID=A0A9E7KSL5_9LILI|nr:Basic region leucine zipper [Musa troglodytarum]